jgi:hypothetical protein
VLSKSRPRTLNLIATYRELASRQISELPSETLLFVSCISETCSPVGEKGESSPARSAPSGIENAPQRRERCPIALPWTWTKSMPSEYRAGRFMCSLCSAVPPRNASAADKSGLEKISTKARLMTRSCST